MSKSYPSSVEAEDSKVLVGKLLLSQRSVVDFRTAQVTTIDGKYAFSMSPSFELGFANAPAANQVGQGNYSYWTVNGVSLTDVAEEPITVERGVAPAFQIFGRTVVRMLNGRVTVITVGEDGIESENAVAGDYTDINWLDVDPTETWIFFGSAETDDQNQFVVSTAKNYLSRLDPTGPSAAHLIGQGYPAENVLWSPNGQSLLLTSYDTSSSTPVAFHLFDLSNLVQGAPGTTPSPTDHTLDLPYNWSNPLWSPDSRYLSFIGGAPQTGARPLYVVDARSPTAAPRLVTTCGPSVPSTPTCPADVALQPGPQ